eukprot:357565-Chlamydomonas_euryale.AAC.6
MHQPSTTRRVQPCTVRRLDIRWRGGDLYRSVPLWDRRFLQGDRVGRCTAGAGGGSCRSGSPIGSTCGQRDCVTAPHRWPRAL